MAKMWVNVTIGLALLLAGCDEGFVREVRTFEKDLPQQFDIPVGATLVEPATSLYGTRHLDGCNYTPVIEAHDKTAVGIAVVPPDIEGDEFFSTLFDGQFYGEARFMLAEVPEPDVLFVVCPMSASFGVPVVTQFWTRDGVVTLDYYVEKNSGGVEMDIAALFVLVDVDRVGAEFESRYLGLFEGNGQ